MSNAQQSGTALDRNRAVITTSHENQILYAAFSGAGGQRYAGVCQVKQIHRKRGKGGETFAIVRFHGDNRMLRLGWRDPNILEVRPMELEDLERYFVQRERNRVNGQQRQNQMNLQVSTDAPAPKKAKGTGRGPGRPRKHPVQPPAPPPAYAQFQSPGEAFSAPQGVSVEGTAGSPSEGQPNGTNFPQ